MNGRKDNAMPTTNATSIASQAIASASLLRYEIEQRRQIREHLRSTGQGADLKDHDAETRTLHAACASAYLDASRWARDAGLTRRARYLAQRYANGPHAERIWLGLGSWLFAKRPAGALDQLRVARDAGSNAQVLFSYDSIADSPALLEALIAGQPGV